MSLRRSSGCIMVGIGRMLLGALWLASAECFANVGPSRCISRGSLNLRGSGSPGGIRARASFLSSASCKLLDGRVLYPKDSGGGWFDARTAAMPVVLPPSEDEAGVWKMWYYGREGEKWWQGNPAFLPTGATGYAESKDGLRWTRVKGPLPGGAVMEPSGDAKEWDSVHIGVTDVIRRKEGGYVMHYLGGGSDAVELSTAPGMGPLVGFRMCSGAATSEDGIAWKRSGAPLVSPGPKGDWDSLFSSWPRALPVDPSNPEGEWLYHYHALQPAAEEGGAPRWAAGVAVSSERYALGNVKKLGRVLEGGGPGSWDERGIGTRHVIHHAGSMWMIFEGVNADGVHSLGLARSADGGRTWAKEMVPGKDEPGGPVFEPRRGEDAWDNRVVGTPWIVPMPSGGFRLYYVGSGFGEDGKAELGIGCAESVGDGLTEWKRVSL